MSRSNRVRAVSPAADGPLRMTATARPESMSAYAAEPLAPIMPNVEPRRDGTPPGRSGRGAHAVPVAQVRDRGLPREAGPAAAWTSAWRSAIRLEFCLQLAGEGLELVRGAMLPPGGLLMTVQERALLGEDEPGAAVDAGGELHGGEGDRHEVGFCRQRRGVDDPLVRDDVPVERLERHDRAAVRAAGGHLAAADPEVELVPETGTRREPPGLGGRFGPGREDAGGRHRVAALERERGVRDVMVHVLTALLAAFVLGGCVPGWLCRGRRGSRRAGRAWSPRRCAVR